MMTEGRVLRMSVREPGSLSRANGAYLVVDMFLKRLEVDEEEEKKEGC